MANPTTRVQSGIVPVPDSIHSGKWPLVNTARAYQDGQMLGVRLSDGFAADLDDTVAMSFLGIVKGHNKQVDAGGASGDQHIDYYRPTRFTMPLSSGTASRATDIGKPVYAASANAGAVTMSPAGLTVANLVGHIADVFVAKPEDLTGSQVEIEPVMPQGSTAEVWSYSVPADQAFFVADRPYIVRGITGRVNVVGSDAGAVTGVIRKAPSGTAPSAGTALHTGTFNLKGTVNENQDLTLSATFADLVINKGDSICFDGTGTMTAATGVIMVQLQPI